uniref:cytochrome c oxidase subunit II n=1 Tax=Mactra alta TaxID=1131947 RepID=UPI00286AD6E1|nr:cytochrome c oxidase subunit II [Mactra alta]WLS55682.1 cytochrome c oxidase subunit 2 [Mactra alta]
MSVWSQYGLLDLCTKVGQGLGSYHDLVLVIIGSVLVGVGLFLIMFLNHKRIFKGMLNRATKSNESLEVVWTLSPAVFLTILGFESLVNLYSMEVGEGVSNSVEAHGHQWYWDYNYVYKFLFVNSGAFLSGLEMNSMKVFSLDVSVPEEVSNFLSELWSRSYLAGEWFVSMESYGVEEGSLSLSSLSSNAFRKMDVTFCCFLWQGLVNEVKVSTSDVMHSWGVPALGVKADAIPGRVNVVGVNPLSSGFYFGNCYELCGPNHSSMPILVGVFNEENVKLLLEESVVSMVDWSSFVEKMSEDNLSSDWLSDIELSGYEEESSPIEEKEMGEVEMEKESE